MPLRHDIEGRALYWGIALAAFAAIGSCQPESDTTADLDAEEDPINRIHSARLKDGHIVDHRVIDLPDDAFSREPEEKARQSEEYDPRPPEKIHPLLQEWVSERPPDELERIVINFKDDYEIPRFPEFDADQPLTSRENQRAARRTQELIKQIKERRAPDYKRLSDELSDLYSAEAAFPDTFWLVKAIVVDMPLGSVRNLSERSDVQYVEPNRQPGQPPVVPDGNSNNDIEDGRRLINSDALFYLSPMSGWIGLLDTGVRFTHTLLNDPSQFRHRGDCIDGGSDCLTGTVNPEDDCWNHGTRSAAVIAGNDSWGPAFRGVTGLTLDSWKVYACGEFFESGDVVRAFQAAIATGDQVIVVQLQGGGNYLNTSSTAADNAFDAGKIVIAANGNYGSSGASSVRTPAQAHKVIGVGAFDVQSGTQHETQSLGPAGDGRIKPDIQTPTNTESASNVSDDAFIVFGGTSGATPYAAGAAALLRLLSGSTDPGQVYALLILFGQTPFPFDNTRGAGPLMLSTDVDGIWWGQVEISDAEVAEIPLPVGEDIGLVGMDAAIWWPEDIFFHNDVDLSLQNPAGTVGAQSTSENGVFERTRLSYDLAECPTPSGSTGAISGRVFDAASGDPIVGAQVGVTAAPAGAVTDPWGCYTVFLAVPASGASYTVTALNLGYHAASVGVFLSPGNPTGTANFALSPPGGTTWKVRIHGADVRLGPQTVYWAASLRPVPQLFGTISGQLVGTTGGVIVGVPVGTSPPMTTSQSNSMGTFMLPNLPIPTNPTMYIVTSPMFPEASTVVLLSSTSPSATVILEVP